MSSVSGYSLIFQQVHDTKLHAIPDEHNTLLTVNKITNRINKNKVHENELHRSFIDNNNLHHLRSHCTGTVVAYTQCKVKNTEEGHGIIWNLGVILYHTSTKTTIVPILVMYDPKYQVYRYNKSSKTISFYDANSELSLRYLNQLSNLKTVASDECFRCILDGPDVLKCFPHNNKQHKIYNSFKKSKKYIATSSDLISKLNRSMDQKKQRRIYVFARSSRLKSMINFKGATLITLKGPLSLLSILPNSHDENDDHFLIPFINECEIKSTNQVKYASISRKQYGEFKSLKKDLTIKEYNQSLATLCKNTPSLSTKVIIPRNNKNGVIFQFIKDDSQSTITSNESILSHQISFDQLPGIVLSYWFPIQTEQAHSIKKEDISAISNVYGHNGFGSRNSIKSGGLNVYTGCKNQPRVMPNPRMCQEDVIRTQIDRINFNKTYSPTVQKLINLLTTQAGQIMSACDPLYDSFIGKVYLQLFHKFKKKEGNRFLSSTNQISTFRRYCNLSIFTGGCAKDQTDSFFNVPHVDKGDKFFIDFQNEALNVMNESIHKYRGKTRRQRQQLQYLHKLFETGHGSFSLPTTCGYQMVQTSNNYNITANDMKSYFCMSGLGYSVQLDNNLYHYFFGNTFTHCTPISISVKNGIVRTYSGDVNVVGWGASSCPRKAMYKALYDPVRDGLPIQRMTQSAFNEWISGIPEAVVNNYSNQSNG